MPTYEYECKKCGQFEVFQGIKDEKLKRCPACKRAVKRLMGSGAGIIFKGSGFYQTDYRSSSYNNGAKADSGSSANPSTTPTPTPAPSPAPSPKASSTEKK
jgi:putative FmdB family regulatory protein